MKRLLLFLLTLSNSAFAMFCPNSFHQINIGDTIETVTQTCGKPDAEKSMDLAANVPQEWIFYVTQGTNAQASVKMAVALVNDKVVNITVNDMSLASTSICGGTIQTGQTSDQIKKACGDPAIVNKTQEASPNTTPPVKIKQFKYNTSPPVTLIFENGFLKERK